MIGKVVDIDKIDLLNKTLDMKNAGYRLAQACASKLPDCIYLLYSFVKDQELVTLRLAITDSSSVESIGWLYPYAFLYENEMKDLFGIDILNMNQDFKGHLFDTAIKTPFLSKEAPQDTVVPSGTDKEAKSNE